MNARLLLVALHSTMRAHRLLCFALVFGLWFGAVLLALRVQTDTGSTAFFPDADAESRSMAGALDLVPASRLLFVSLSTERENGATALAEAADALVRRLPAHLARPVEAVLPDPAELLQLLPYYTDEKVLARLEAALDPQVADDAVRAVHARLGSLLASGPALGWLQADPLGLLPAVLSRLPDGHARTPSDPVLGYPVSTDGRHLLLVLRPAHSLHDVDAAVQLLDAVENGLAHILAPDMRALVVGGQRHSAVNTRTIHRDMAFVAGFSLAALLAVYLALVRSAGAVWLLLTPCVAASMALGGMTLLFPVLSGLALGFGAATLGLAEDYAVHVHFALREGASAEDALHNLAAPLFQGYLVNISGFVVLLFSGLPAVRQLACFSLLALSAGFVLAITVLPLCPWFSGPRLHASVRTAMPVQPSLWRTGIAASLLLSLCFFLFFHVGVDVSPRSMGADAHLLHEDARRLEAIWGSSGTTVLVVEGANMEDAMHKARRLSHALRRVDPAVDLLTPGDIWPGPEEARENVRRWTRFAREHGQQLRGLLAEAARRHGFADNAFASFFGLLQQPVAPFGPDVVRAAGLGELLDTFVPGGAVRAAGERARVLLFAGPGTDFSRVEGGTLQDVLILLPGFLEKTLSRQFASERHLLPLAWMACFAVLFACLKSARMALFASLPPLCSIGTVLAWMACTGQPLTLAGMAALPLVLGLSADHGILVAHELVRGIRAGAQRAVLVSSLTTLAGMGLLALASHPVLRAMGEVVFWGLLAEIPVALWLLPGLCVGESAGAVCPAERHVGPGEKQ